ncbi:MAG: hypothetical protein K2X82_19035 [Gemmataceae bacterium]|nr:hypothetical protein [Gemmataceae bacterium]
MAKKTVKSHEEPVPQLSLSGRTSPTPEASRADASQIPEVIAAARRLADSIVIIRYVDATLFEVDTVAAFGVEHPLMDALEARHTIETKELPNLTGAVRTGWVKLLLAVTEATHRPSGDWSADRIEAALNQIEAAYRIQYPGPTQHPASPGPTGEQDRRTESIPHRAQVAYQLYNFAEQELERACTDDEAYRWLRKHRGGELELPPVKSWKRYLRTARAHYDQRKHNLRVGRIGRSIVTPDQIEDRFDD